MKAFTPLILIALSIIAFFMYIKPQFTVIQDLNAQKDRYAIILQKAKELSAKRDVILSEYNAIDPADIVKLKKIISEKFDSVTIAKHLNSVASKYGILIKGIKISEPNFDSTEVVATANPNQVKDYTVEFNFKGTYSQSVSFIKDIESGLLLMDVEKLTITSEAKNLNSNIYNFGVKLVTYSLN